MKNIIKAVVVAAAIGVGTAYALPDIDDVSGALSKTDIETAITPLGQWFDQAEAYCRNHDYSTCEVRLSMTVKRGSTKPQCQVAYTTIQTDASRQLYCKVASQTSYPAHDQDSSFSLLFNIEPKQALPTPAPVASSANVSPTPSLRGLLTSREWAHRTVHGCEDQAGARSTASVNACFDANVGNFYWPFRHARLRNPDMQGVIDVRVEIAKDGHVTKAEAEAVNGPLDAQFVDGVISAVNAINFHSASEDTVIEHSLNFN